MLTIEVVDGPEYRVGGTPVTREGLFASVAEAAREPTRDVVVKASPNVSVDRVLFGMRALAAARVWRLEFDDGTRRLDYSMPLAAPFATDEEIPYLALRVVAHAGGVVDYGRGRVPVDQLRGWLEDVTGRAAASTKIAELRVDDAMSFGQFIAVMEVMSGAGLDALGIAPGTRDPGRVGAWAFSSRIARLVTVPKSPK